MKLFYGVSDVPYAALMTPREQRQLRWRTGRRPWQALPGTTTTGDVAEILEARYSVFGHFHEMHGDEVVDMISTAMQSRLEAVMSGAPVGEGSLLPEGSLSAIEQRFRAFLDNRELDGRVAGVPTRAALKGVNHRLAHPYAKDNPGRPSFIDTGMYQSNVRVWTSE